MKKNSVLVVLFFVLLFFGLFLGDGKQWAIDVYGATMAIVISVYSLFIHGDITRKPPRSVSVAWRLVAVVVFISTILSDSVGYSFSWMVRLLSGALLYRVFYNISFSDTEKTFARALSVFVGISAVLFIGVYMFPSLDTLPSMSLLGTNYGHSHFADLFVLVAPMLLNYIYMKNSIFSVALAMLYIVVLYMTRARGATLVVCVYALIFWYKVQKAQMRGYVYKMFAVALSVYIGISIIVMVLPQNKFVKFVKSDPITNRAVYWQQAIDVFVGRPFFGSGPGTFSLSSVQKQRTPWVSSWFAHSAPLQMLSELGFFGLLVFGWLLVVHGRQVLHNKERFLVNSPRVILTTSLALLLIYSCFEYVLDYFVIWMLFWAILGLLSGAGITREPQKRVNISVVLAGVLGVFYLLWVCSFIVTLTTKRADIAFYLAPFDSVQALMFLETKSSQQPKQSDVVLIEVFHRNNSIILDAISKLKERQGDDARALLYAKRAAFASPQNSGYYTRYFSLLAGNNQTEVLGNEILALSKIALPRRFLNQIGMLEPYAKGFGQYYVDWMLPERSTYVNGYASMFYRLGIADLRDVEPTERLLILAKDIYPDLAYLHVELAAFYQHIRGDADLAKETLLQCQRYPSAAQQCREQLLFPLYYPAEYKMNIL
ncbi:O-antigen ligase family protein [Candidatus Woesebacteria bacterium]|nr:O-antigen ligase family protein [Candidatus Woesebacteria bacterium]